MFHLTAEHNGSKEFTRTEEKQAFSSPSAHPLAAVPRHYSSSSSVTTGEGAAEKVSVCAETWNDFNLASGSGQRNDLGLRVLLQVGGEIHSRRPLSIENGKGCRNGKARLDTHTEVTLKHTFGK